MLIECFVLRDILTNWTSLRVCCSEHVAPSERFCPCLYWFSILTSTLWLSGSDYFLILVFWFCTRSELLLFFTSCSVLKIRNLLFVIPPSANLLQVLSTLLVTNWIPSSFQGHIEVASTSLHFGRESMKYALYQVIISDSISLSVGSKNLVVLTVIWRARRGGLLWGNASVFLSYSHLVCNSGSVKNQSPSKAGSVTHWLSGLHRPPSALGAGGASKGCLLLKSPEWDRFLNRVEPVPASMWKMALEKLNYLFHGTQVA